MPILITGIKIFKRSISKWIGFNQLFNQNKIHFANRIKISKITYPLWFNGKNCAVLQIRKKNIFILLNLHNFSFICIYYSSPEIFITCVHSKRIDFNLNRRKHRSTYYTVNEYSCFIGFFFFHHAGNKIVAITVEWQPLIATRVTSIYLNAETLRFTLLLQPVQLEAGVASLSTLILLLSFIVFFFWLWISSFLGIDNSYESCNELTKVHDDF